MECEYLRINFNFPLNPLRGEQMKNPFVINQANPKALKRTSKPKEICQAATSPCIIFLETIYHDPWVILTVTKITRKD